MIYSLYEFFERVIREHSKNFIHFDYVRELCLALEDCVSGTAGNTTNVLITIPPRHYKTTLVSQAFPAWCLGEISPDCEFILTSATAGLATANAIEISRIMTSPWYKQLYPDTIISKFDRELLHNFKTEAGGSIYASGLGGTITGYGAGKAREGFGGALIIDDPLKADDAFYPLKRDKCVRYYLETLKSRRNSVFNTPIIAVAQRLHVDDLPGWILKNEAAQWDVVAFPALQDGKVLNPVTTSVEELEELKVVSPGTFYAQYQQTPIVPGGNLIKSTWWKVYDPEEVSLQGAKWITADTAYKEHAKADVSVIQCWEGTRKGLYFIDSIYGRWSFPTLLSNIKKFSDTMKAIEIWVEDKASGTPLVQTLEFNEINAFAWNPHDFSFPSDKVSRMQEAAWMVYGGHVFVPKGTMPVRVNENEIIYVTPAAAALIEEASCFSRDLSHAYDDHCDAFTMAISLYREAIQQR